MNYLTVPILIIGLEQPSSFEIKHIYPKDDSKTKLGMIYKNGQRIIREGEEELKDKPTV